MAGDEAVNGKWQRQVAETLGRIDERTDSIQRELSEFKGWSTCEINALKDKLDKHIGEHSASTKRLTYFVSGSAITVMLSGISIAISLLR